MKDLFEREQLVYEGAVKLFEESDASSRDAYEALAKEYGRLLKQLRRITKLSDRTAIDLNASRLDMLGKLLRMSSLAESSPNFISYKHFTGECVYINPAASILTGYSHDELMNGYIDLLLDVERAAYIRNNIPNELKEKGILNYELPLKRKDGEIRIFSICSFLVETDDDAYGNVAADITEKRQIESEKIAALKKAEQASQAKSNFLSQMSHEMRTPMNAIIGMASIAQRAGDMEEARGCFEKIKSSADHLLRIIDDILDMSKVHWEETELSEEEFRLRDVLEQISAAMKFRFDEKHQSFSIIPDESIPESISTDKAKLLRVLTNLLGNANKFTQEHGIISLSVRKIRAFESRCNLQFDIEDNGIGVCEEQQSRIFSAFEQSDNTITRQYGGAGLGLAISRKFIGMMGGEIWVDSKPGVGSTFSFTINVGADELSLDMPPDTDSDIENIFAGKHILVVDDVEINREILIELLSDTGITISCAENGLEANNMFAANPSLYDIIFMDIHMPVMDGYEAAKAIRETDSPSARGIPIIAVTADENTEESMKAGINDIIRKPLYMDVIIAKMKQYLL